MRKYIASLVIILCFASPLTMHVKAASEYTINDLIENAKELDEKEITVQGEAIGEGMNRGNYSWININDGTNAIGLWVKQKTAVKVDCYGNYKYIGDTIKITGIFHRACIEHGGEADIHVNNLKVVKEGYRVNNKISMVKVISTIIIVFMALIILLIFNKKVINKK